MSVELPAGYHRFSRDCDAPELYDGSRNVTICQISDLKPVSHYLMSPRRHFESEVNDDALAALPSEV